MWLPKQIRCMPQSLEELLEITTTDRSILHEGEIVMMDCAKYGNDMSHESSVDANL